MSAWLDEHLETFVKPHLGYIPSDFAPEKDYLGNWLKQRYVKGLQACWFEAKRRRKGRPILLAGRDVFLFELLAQLEGFPETIFRPEISATVAQHVDSRYAHCFCIDTGYSGTVPKRLKIPNFALISYTVPFALRGKDGLAAKLEHQLFPYVKRGPISGLSYTLEGSPKYWTRGSMVKKDTEISQHLSGPNEFLRATLLTLFVSHYVPHAKKKRTYVRSIGRGL